MEEILTRLEAAIRRGQQTEAAALVDELRRASEERDALWATVECALTELDGSTDLKSLLRFVRRIEGGLDHDAGQ